MIRVLAITGKMGSGKSTITDLITKKATVPITTVKFAGALYEMQDAIYKIIDRPIPQPKDRKLLQWLGTEWGRAIDKDLWIKLWKTRAEHFLNSNQDSLVICDDCRFDNEAALVLEMGGAVVEIEASREERAKRIPLVESAHVSEQGISQQYISQIIANNSTLNKLNSDVNNILTRYDIPHK